MKDLISADTAGVKRSALFVTTLAVFLTPFGISSVNIALPSIGKEFLMDAVLLGWVSLAYLLVTAMFLVPFGKIADIYGRRRIFSYGIITFTLGSMGSSVSNSAAMLLCFRILQGIGAAAMYPVGIAILTSVFPSGELGRVLGINAVSVYLGFSLGPFLGGFLTHYYGWRSVFVVNVLVGLTVIFLMFWKLKGEWYGARGDHFDLTGSIIYGSALFIVMFGFSELSTTLGACLVVLGFLSVYLFVKWETKAKTPLLEISFFKKNRGFALSNLATFINYGATSVVTFLLSLYLQYIKGLTPENAGLILVSQPIVQGLFSPYSGRLSDRSEPRIVASIGMVLTAVGLFLLTFLNEKTASWFIVASLILLGFGYALFSAPNTKAVMSSVENRFYGVASGTLSTMRMTGMVFSTGTALLVFSIYIGKAQITSEYYPLFLTCMKLTFAFFGVLCLGGVFASLASGKVR
jgi:EmrB/QacA subfamily drug resistance transporter